MQLVLHHRKQSAHGINIFPKPALGKSGKPYIASAMLRKLAVVGKNIDIDPHNGAVSGLDICAW
jgi:hypothetical protein